MLAGDSFALPLADFLVRHFEDVLLPETGQFEGEVVAHRGAWHRRARGRVWAMATALPSCVVSTSPTTQ